MATACRKNGNDHKRGARVHPASPDLTVAVMATTHHARRHRQVRWNLARLNDGSVTRKPPEAPAFPTAKMLTATNDWARVHPASPYRNRGRPAAEPEGIDAAWR